MGCYLGQEAGVSASTQRATYDTDMAFGESKQGGVAEALGTEPACTERTVGVGGREDGQEGQRRGGVGGGGEGRAGGTRIGRNGAGALEPWVTGSHLYRKQAGDPEQALPAVLGEPSGSLSRGPLGAAWWPLLPPQLETGWPHVPGRRTCCPAACAQHLGPPGFHAPAAGGRSRWPRRLPPLAAASAFSFRDTPCLSLGALCRRFPVSTRFPILSSGTSLNITSSRKPSSGPAPQVQVK